MTICAKPRHCLTAGLVLPVTVALLGAFISPPVDAQSADQEQAERPPAKRAKAKAAKPRTPPSSTGAVEPKGAKAPPQKATPLDLARADPMQIDVGRIDHKKLDGKMPNAWIALGRLEGLGGNFAGARESLERAMTLGDQSRNKAAVAAAALALATIHSVSFNFLAGEARNVGLFGARPSADLTGKADRERERAKQLIEKALALHMALGRKDYVAIAYDNLGDLYARASDYEQAQAVIGQALALNKALQNKKRMAANYRALADTHRYDLDQAEALLREAVALDKELELNEALAEDYSRLAALNKSRGEPYEAERLYKQALALTPRLEQGLLLRALQRLYEDRSDPGQAAEMREQAGAIAKEREKDGGGRMLLFDSSLGLWMSSAIAKRQLEAIEKVVPMEKKLGHWVGLATSYALLGLHYGQRAEIDEEQRADFEGRAEAMFREAVALNRTLRREPAMAHAYSELALIVDRRGKLDEVEATLKDVQALYKKLGQEAEMARLYSSLGHARHRRGDKAQACTYWRSGASAYPDDKKLREMPDVFKCTATQ